MTNGVLNHCVFIDECGYNIWTARTHGRARVGDKSLPGQVCGQRGQNVTVTMDISPLDGLVYHSACANWGDECTTFRRIFGSDTTTARPRRAHVLHLRWSSSAWKCCQPRSQYSAKTAPAALQPIPQHCWTSHQHSQSSVEGWYFATSNSERTEQSRWGKTTRTWPEITDMQDLRMSQISPIMAARWLMFIHREIKYSQNRMVYRLLRASAEMRQTFDDHPIHIQQQTLKHADPIRIFCIRDR